ncbi:hypothetical protein A628_00250 [Salmonella enterica subsp. enterica serovar Cubana str. 76814]|uniref:Uncharacterized protein n=1 Tax=Salmonella enterica subsp. enterica serovar Cubana str. 76814 TaxID=1192560 RepID=V7IU08_SALET|nr:hypothetical protein A628_00250 [Salmonella enterica subsp. enterica serovar Cubana str. 76814]
MNLPPLNISGKKLFRRSYNLSKIPLRDLLLFLFIHLIMRNTGGR